MIPALLDCDTGHDDAMAILMAGRRLDLRGVTTVFGNATVADTTDNTCRILELAGLAHVPVAAGAAAPLEGAFVHEAGVHGMTGMDGHDLPPPAGGAIDEPAVDFIARNAAATRGLHLVATGPLTNIARVLTSFPGARAALAGISIMGDRLARVTPPRLPNTTSRPIRKPLTSSSPAVFRSAWWGSMSPARWRQLRSGDTA